MRWNPQNPGQHQYASDIKWVDNIADMMKNIMTTLVLKRKYTKNTIDSNEVSTWSSMSLTLFRYVKFTIKSVTTNF